MDIYRIVVRETNCYLLRGEDGVVLVDPGPPGVSDRVIAAAQRGGVDPGEVRLILVTHGHLDHYGAAPGVRAWCGAPVAASPGEPDFSRDRRNALPPAQTVRGAIVRAIYLLLASLTHLAPLETDLALDEGDDLAAYGLEGRIIRLPGHAPGSLGIVTPDGQALIGDLLVNYTVPSQPMYLSDEEAWELSCQRLRALEPRTVYVGHGEPFPGSELADIHPARYQFRWWVW
jgi:glyoxylase-like metal-dependent hydrolase (beta-lactamase superfamily II)